MDGFHSSLFSYLFTSTPPSSSPPPPTGDNNMDDTNALPCLNFLLKPWTLDTPTKFTMAMTVVILLGIMAEGLAAARSGGLVQNMAHRLARYTKCQEYFVKLGILTTHTLQALIGYILMLAAMSYSLELLGSVLIGLGVGYATFFELDGGLDEGNDGYGGLDGDGDDYGYEEVEDDDDANDDTTTPARSGGRNGNYASNSTSTATAGAASSCCDVPGRGPPRRAFQFLRSPVTTLAGVGRKMRDEHSEHNGTDQADALALHGSDGDGADNLSLHEDDKMTPLL